MRYRKLAADGDMIFGHGGRDFHQDSPEAVAQAVLTRLLLWRGEWFLDQSQGLPWAQLVLGKHTQGSYDLAIRSRVLDTPGVTGIAEYASSLDGESRKLSVPLTIDTRYGQARLRPVPFIPEPIRKIFGWNVESISLAGWETGNWM